VVIDSRRRTRNEVCNSPLLVKLESAMLSLATTTNTTARAAAAAAAAGDASDAE